MYEAKRFDIHGRTPLKTNVKYYSVDLGLRRLLVPDHLEDYGHIIENIVYLELVRRGGKVYVGVNNILEVDFVVVKADQSLEYYQVALTTLDSNVLERELRSLKSIDDNYPKHLITPDTFNKEANYDGIQKINLIDWLLE